MKEVKLGWWVKRRIRKLYSERYTIDELYLMYKKIIPYKQLRELVKDVNQYERI